MRCPEFLSPLIPQQFANTNNLFIKDRHFFYLFIFTFKSYGTAIWNHRLCCNPSHFIWHNNKCFFFLAEQWLKVFKSSTKVSPELQTWYKQVPRAWLSVNAICPNTPQYLSHLRTRIANYALTFFINHVQHLNLAFTSSHWGKTTTTTTTMPELLWRRIAVRLSLCLVKRENLKNSGLAIKHRRTHKKH